MCYVYILLCNENSFYIGYASNLQRRIKQHNNKIGSNYLTAKVPVKLVYFEKIKLKLDAIKRERQLKGWSKTKKINLIKYGHPTKF